MPSDRRLPTRQPTVLAAALLAIPALLITACSEPRQLGSAPPVIGAMSAAQTDLTTAQRGRVLLDELGCTNCHETPGSHPRPGPDLATAGTRLRSAHIREFLDDPVGAAPGTTMPDLLRDLAGDERTGAVRALAAFVESMTGSDSRRATNGALPDANDETTVAAIERGGELFESIGCTACHRDLTAVDPGQGIPLGDLDSKYRTGALRAFLLAPHEARPGGRMPDFGLSPAEAADLAAFLRSRSARPSIPKASTVRQPAAVTRELLAEGRKLFGARRCNACHALPVADTLPTATTQPPALAELRTAADHPTGCLSTNTGAWPFYALTAAQRHDLRAAIAAASAEPTVTDRIARTLAAHNCAACHERAGVGTPRPRTTDAFGTHDPTLGLAGRVPPTLTGVGAKLQADWLEHAIAHGQHERPYLHTRMPGFGEALARRLAADLAELDLATAAKDLPPVTIAPLPKDRDARKKVQELGREVVGDKGMNCITCHYFAGEQVGAMGSIDLVHSTGRRLRPEWFAQFLLDPVRFRPGTLMPQFFPGGKSTRPELGDGDSSKQIAGMWHYLATGRNVRQPRGLRRKPIELTATDRAVILRRSVHGTGKRGISVAYPGGVADGVNLTFDAETLALNQIWWGRFLDAGPVWRSQGHGRAHVLGKPRCDLGKGPAFAELDEPNADWPAKTRRELGQEWRGYDLDDDGRPTFRYSFGAIEIRDTPREDGSTGKLALTRVLTLAGTGERTVTFLAARNAVIEALDGDRFAVGDKLVIGVTNGRSRIHQAKDSMELRVDIDSRPNGSQIELRYEVKP
ncbi:MAG: c-type cytochrome [bacterium]|nr:c-type cytochrome [bacterium]